MAKNYHVLQGTSVVGPLQLDELGKLVQKGVVSGQTLVSDDGSTWKPASVLVPYLFGNEPSKSPPSSGGTLGGEHWYVQSNGQQYGPITYTELLGWVSSKSVVADSLVRKSENGPWHRADTVFPHLGVRSLAPKPAKPSSTSSPISAVSIRTDTPSKPLDRPAESSQSGAGSGSDVAMTVLGFVGALVIGYAFVQGMLHMKAAFGFLGVIAVFMAVRFFMSLGKFMRNIK